MIPPRHRPPRRSRTPDWMWNAPPEVPEVSPAQTASLAPAAPVGTGLYGVDATGQTWQYVPPEVIPLSQPGGPFLPISGGQLTGPLLLNTVPVAADAGVVAVDTDMLRSYGFVGGGVGSTLASKFSTLAAAQAVYPHAIALTDTLDWAAVQGWINAVNALPLLQANGVAILFPAGDVIINRPIVSGAKALFMRGAGPFATRILCNTAGNDLFQHGLTSQGLFAAFEMADIGLACTVAGVGYAINIRQNMSTGQFRLENVRFTSFSASFSWLGYVNAEGTTHTILRNVYASGGEFNPPDQQAAMTQVGYQFNSPNNNNRSFVFYFDNCEIGAIQHAVLVNLTGPPGNTGSVEGMIFRGTNGRSNTGAWLKVAITQSQGAWQPPFFVFDNCNVQSGAAVIDADGISELHINDCLFYLEAPQAGTTTGNYMNLTNVHEAYITNNTITTFAGAAVASFIWFGPNSQNCFVRDNTFYISDPSITVGYAGIGCDSTVQNLRTLNNIYFGNWPVGVPYESDSTNGANGNRMEMSDANRFVIVNGHGPALQLIDATGPVANYFGIQPASAGFGPQLLAEGSDANVSLIISSKGNGTLYLNGPVQASSSLQADGILDTSINYQAPVSGATITMTVATGLWLVLNPAGTLATLTVALPASPANGLTVIISTTQQITALTLTSGGTFVYGNLGAMGAVTSAMFRYVAAGGFWLRTDHEA